MTGVAVPRGALDGLTVLDLTGARGNYCGKLLAELGADVILVESPDGTELRHHPPFARDDAGGAHSLRFAYQNTSKRSIVLDLEQHEDRTALRGLVANADILIESFAPGHLATLSLSYEHLRAVNPRLVMASITAFGQSGPYSGLDAPDLICLAASGFLSLGGYEDGSPMRAPDEQGHIAAGLFAATAILIAVLHSEATGEGQHIDVSVQESLTMALENAVQCYDLEGVVRGRTGGAQKQAGTGLFQASDGYVFLMATGIGGNRFWPNLVEWLVEDAASGAERLTGPEWTASSHLDSDGAKAVFDDVFAPYAAARTRDELVALAQGHRVPLAAVKAPSEVLSSRQLSHRGFPQELEYAPGKRALAPGAPYLLSATPWRSTQRPPLLGQHTHEVLTQVAAASPGGGA